MLHLPAAAANLVDSLEPALPVVGEGKIFCALEPPWLRRSSSDYLFRAAREAVLSREVVETVRQPYFKTDILSADGSNVVEGTVKSWQSDLITKHTPAVSRVTSGRG